ncbi:hypothetical protein Tco_0292135 [Tanacetum coccineum]
MYQFWNTIQKVKCTNAYRFKLDKKKFRVDTEFFREILQTCPRILNQYFIAPPSEKELVTFIQELGYSSKYDMLCAIYIDQMHQPWRTFTAIINRKTLCVIIKDTPGVPVSKKKAHSKGDRGKGMELLYDAALLGVAQMKESWGDSGDDDNDDDSNEVC